MNIAENRSTATSQDQASFLNNELRQRDEKIVSLNQGIVERDQEIACLKEQLAWFKRQIFGKRSERVVSNLNNQQLSFEGFESPASKEEEKKTVASHRRRIPKRNGQDKIILPDDLPVKTTMLDIPQEQKICQETGQSLVQIGVEISHKLAHEPGSYYIKEIIRPKYAHPKKEENGILIAPLPDSFLPKSRADESFLAQIIVQKFADHRAPRTLISEEQIKGAA